MTQIDDRIRHAYGPAHVDDLQRERVWQNVVDPAKVGRAPIRGWRAPRTLLGIAVALVSFGSVALAQPGPIDNLIGGKSHAERMQVFDQPDPVGTTGLSEMADGMFGSSDRTGFGSVDPERLHKVLDYEGTRYHVKVRSGASADGQACLYHEVYDTRRTLLESGGLRSGGGGCSLSMEYNGHVTVSTGGDIRLGTLVLGLADDDVQQVRVKLSDGRTVPAQMGNNGYLLHVPNHKVKTRGLLVDLKDGRTIDVAMNGCLRSQVTPPLRSRLGCGFGMNKGPAREVR